LGVSAPSEAETFYDELLREKVTAFQSSRGLKPDGIIGTLTFLSLQTAGPSVGIPRLSPVAP
jgi:murein L,D-transpeptidase YcbB/YkuD